MCRARPVFTRSLQDPVRILEVPGGLRVAALISCSYLGGEEAVDPSKKKFRALLKKGDGRRPNGSLDKTPETFAQFFEFLLQNILAKAHANHRPID
jgi:hypothetical protein